MLVANDTVVDVAKPGCVEIKENVGRTILEYLTSKRSLKQATAESLMQRQAGYSANGIWRQNMHCRNDVQQGLR